MPWCALVSVIFQNTASGCEAETLTDHWPLHQATMTASPCSCISLSSHPLSLLLSLLGPPYRLHLLLIVGNLPPSLLLSFLTPANYLELSLNFVFGRPFVEYQLLILSLILNLTNHQPPTNPPPPNKSPFKINKLHQNACLHRHHRRHLRPRLRRPRLLCR